ncbi:MAG: hypothetical protein ACLGH0_06105, partial [Thermoanaerobaculia bacterium]
LYPSAAVAKLYGMQRGWEEVLRFSAHARDWLPGQVDPELRLFPGWLAYALAVAALLFARRSKAVVLLALLWILLGFAGSLGLHFEFHKFLFGAVPGFRAIRVPARWAVIAYIGMSVLIAVTTSVLPRRLRFVVPLALVAALWVAPIRWFLTDPDPREVYRWLAKQNVTAVAELPIDSLSSDYEYLLHATAHHKRIINGVSGFAPPERVEFSALSKETPIPDRFVDALRAAGVELVIVHADTLGDRAGEVRAWLRRELDRGRISFVRKFHTPIEGDWVFSLRPTGGGRPHALENFLDGRETCSDETMGALDFPQGGYRFRNGDAIFSGWVMSPHGVRQVDLWFDNRREHQRANLMPWPQLQTRCPGDKRMTRLRYIAVFDKRPEGIDRKTDIQVEVTDGRGHTTLFDNRWIEWE